MTENCWTEDGDRGLIIAAHDKKLSGKHYEKCFGPFLFFLFKQKTESIDYTVFGCPILTPI